METLDQRVHQARSEYLSATIEETQAVCNALEAIDADKYKLCQQIAQIAGDNAQQKFEVYVELVNELKASKDNEN